MKISATILASLAVVLATTASAANLRKPSDQAHRALGGWKRECSEDESGFCGGLGYEECNGRGDDDEPEEGFRCECDDCETDTSGDPQFGEPLTCALEIPDEEDLTDPTPDVLSYECLPPNDD